MFDRYLAEALATHFSHIISDFDADKVKISVWNGEVVLKDLTLKEDAIQQFQGGADLPFKIAYGNIGTFELHIPWNVLKFSQRTTKRSKKQEKAEAGSCSVILSDVNILISPGASHKRSNEKETKDPHAEKVKKERMVQNILDEALFRKNIQEVSVDDSNDKKSFINNFVKNIISSLTITVRNVHIRYEDSGDCLGFETQPNVTRKTRHRPPFAVGIALEEFSLGNTNRGPEKDDELYRIPDMEGITVQNKDEPKISTHNELYSSQHKLAAAKNLSVYWDSDLSSNDLIHVTTKRLLRRRKIEREKLNDVDSDHDLSEDEDVDEDGFGTTASRLVDRMESETILDESRNDMFSSMLEDALHSQDYQRTFIVQPISPSLRCTIVSANHSSNVDDSPKQLPPSRAVLTLPSFQMSINKNTLEDIAYFRRSFKLWNEMKTNFLAKKMYNELTSSRPKVSPLEDPRSWWLYSFEAVKTLSRIRLKSESESGKSKKGWEGFVEAVQQRKEYVKLYRSVLDTQTSDEKREELNAQLCELEGSLDSQKIIAFRVYAVSTMLMETNSNKEDEKLSRNELSSSSKGMGWFKWNNDHTTDVDPDSSSPQEGLQQQIFSENDMLTLRYRETINAELVTALELEIDLGFEAIFCRNEGESESTGLRLLKENVNSEMTVLCPQMILQIDDIASLKSSTYHSPDFAKQKSRQRCPVIQVRCVSIQKICFYQNSNWDVTSTFASLEILDLMESYSSFNTCPKLLTRKRSWVDQVSSLDTRKDLEGSVLIGAESHEHGGTMYIRKFQDHFDSACQRKRVATSVNVKLSPMEIVYSPETVKTISKVFSTTKTSELTHDYQRLKLILSNWRAQQKEKIIEVLTQKENRLLINVDIAAPVFLMHDKTSNGTLVVDLGRLLFRDVNDTSMKGKGSDDTWNLSLQNIQVLSMPRPEEVSPSAYNLVHHHDKCHLVEPFSLEFMVGTKFKEQDPGILRSQIVIDATLPRLVFNLSSSAVRLVHRLTDYRQLTKSRAKPEPNISPSVKGPKVSLSGFSSVKNAEESKKTSTIHFRFSAPLIVLRLANDVDGRDSIPENKRVSAKIVELRIQGIGGKLCRTSVDGYAAATSFSARLKSLHAQDLFQQAGEAFSNLLSSECLNDGDFTAQGSSNSGTSSSNPEGSDLVRVKFNNNERDIDTEFGKCAKSLVIQFHELYVEWNPETIAAIQKALRLSRKEKMFFKEFDIMDGHRSLPHSPERFGIGKTFSADESVAFFDAMEEETDDEDLFLSEISSEDDSRLNSPLKSWEGVPIPAFSPFVAKAMKVMSIRKLKLNEDIIDIMHNDSESTISDYPHENHREVPTISISFELSKLRFRFNKESRFRRLVVAEMNKTLIRFQSKPYGGAETVATLGNFTLTDPSAFDGSTLYGEILGLKTDASRSESMLKITHETFPRDQNNLYDIDKSVLEETEKSLRIDKEKRCTTWCDTMITMHFSPMRFVLLKELWMEVIDYFFEGIVGYEVLGRQKPDVLSAVDEHQKKVETEIMDSGKHDLEDSNLPGANADGIRFLRFEITLDSPVIVFPVQYRSPQHLRFDLDKIHIANKHNGTIEDFKHCARYVQWYNNCSIDCKGLRLLSWCGTQLNTSKDPKNMNNNDECENESRIPMKLSLRWPVGPFAHTIVPKWKFHCSIDSIRLLFRKKDYALFQHIVWNNIGEESRHLDEWRSLQNLPPKELAAHKKNIMVHFGYDKKDGPPTTFHFTVDISSVIFHFCIDENDLVADVEGSKMKWSFLKKKDRVSRQVLTFDNIRLSQTSSNKEWAGVPELLFPLKESSDSTPQLTYKSTSKLCGDNVKALIVKDACIFLVYPAWIFVKTFFQNIPNPDIMDIEEVQSSVQIADRWYRTQKEQLSNLESPSNVQSRKAKVVSPTKILADFQLRIVLESPRIVLVDDPSQDSCILKKGQAVTLGLGHLDFLHHNDPRKAIVQKTLFLHDLEVFTGTTMDAISALNQQHHHSLLYPLCLGAGLTSCYQSGDLVETRKWIASDVVSVRSAYTDMTLAIDVFLRVISDYREVQNAASSPSVNIANAIVTSSKTHNLKPLTDIKNSICVACGGFDLLVVDDSNRHFAGTQELVQVSLSGILYRNVTATESSPLEMRLQLFNLELADCLQPLQSPFRIVAVGNHVMTNGKKDMGSAPDDKRERWRSMNRKVFDDFMDWEDYSMKESKEWGYEISSLMDGRRSVATRSHMRQPFYDLNLIDIHHTISAQNHYEYRFRIRAAVLQWNPSMAIALQRFLGRLKKQAMERNIVSQSRRGDSSHDKSVSQEQKAAKHQGAEIQIDSLTLCVNKEHQHRRLLQITMSKAFVTFQYDKFSRVNVSGHLGDFNAWDSDGNRAGQAAICQKNRLIIGVLHRPSEEGDGLCEESEVDNEKLLTFKYYSNPNPMNDSQVLNNKRNVELPTLPEWVKDQVGANASIDAVDDCLFLSIATLRFNHIKDRNGEIIDYLSNGLPGRGMGATKRAAKGFISNRIKTRSFTNVLVKSPQLFFPRNRGDPKGVVVCLGDVRLNSWFDEATIIESKEINCNELKNVEIRMYDQVPLTPRTATKESRKYWWRVLSVSITGLGWRVNRETGESLSTSLQIENPVNFHLQMRKPPSECDLPIIVRCKLTAMELVLCYSEYVLLRAVLKENITKKVDKTLWDNLEDSFLTDEDVSSGVRYSKNARFVRYGDMSARHSLENGKTVETTPSISARQSLDVQFSLTSVALVLHRDDTFQEVKDLIAYNIVLLEVDDIYMQLAANTDNSKTGTVTFKSFALSDVGDIGRLDREKMLTEQSIEDSSFRERRKSSAFSVIARGYNTTELEKDVSLEKLIDPQLIISIDTKSSTKVDTKDLNLGDQDIEVTSIRVTLNHMNINPLIRPLSEVADFVSGAWPIEFPGVESEAEATTDKVEEYTRNFEKKEHEGTNQGAHLQSDIAAQPSAQSPVRGFHVTIITNYPRVFLVPDETDPSTRALVLRGLTIVNGSMVKNTTSTGLSNSTVASIQGQVHSLESYINPDPRSILESILMRGSTAVCTIDEKYIDEPYVTADDLGVALIEPVTASFSFRQTKRPNFPTVREAFISMEPVSTTLSFEDIKLVEVVISRWKSNKQLGRMKNIAFVDSWRNASDDMEIPFDRSTETNIDAQSCALSTDNSDEMMYSRSLDAQNDAMFCGNCLPTTPDSVCFPTPSGHLFQPDGVAACLDSYEIIFKEQKLGLVLRRKELAVLIEDNLDTKLDGKIKIGDEIVSVEGVEIAGMPFQSVVNLLSNTKRPMKVTFQKSAAKILKTVDEFHPKTANSDLQDIDIGHSTDTEKSFESEAKCPTVMDPSRLRETKSVVFKKGLANGIEIEQSPCGNIAVVSSIDQKSYSACCVDRSPFKYVPVPGSAILALNHNNVPSHEREFESISKFMKASSASIQGNSDIGTYTLTFLDAPSADWGAFDKVDIVIAGVKLTLIDDINGRDMPLLRGTLDSIALKIERGLGLKCNSIKVTPPSLLTMRQIPCQLSVFSDLTEVITRICASAEICVDYYNARIAVWEPLVEPALLSIEVESQKGNKSISFPRAGALSVSLSDFRPVEDMENLPFMCLNVTDSAADILLTALHEWKLWRKIIQQEADVANYAQMNDAHSYPQSDVFMQGLPSQQSPRHDKGSPPHDIANRFLDDNSSKFGAAQNAAQAALIFARRRGLDSQKSGDSKPFVFRNRTGMTISFAPEMNQSTNSSKKESNSDRIFNLNHLRPVGVTSIEDGKEARFNLETMAGTSYNVDRSLRTGNGNKVRSYDGQFPLLSVDFDTSSQVQVEVLQHMSVVRIGDTMRSLFFRKAESQDKYKTSSVLIVWSVELENNRRIITLSSAVRVSSVRCGIPIQVGVRQIRDNQSSDSAAVQFIGTSTSTHSCFLPLWLELSLIPAEILVRPFPDSSAFKWSNTRVLRLERLKNIAQYASDCSSYVWEWTVSGFATTVECERELSSSSACNSAWLSYDYIYDSSKLLTEMPGSFYQNEFCGHEYRMKCIDVCSGLSLRNGLPVSLEWEISSQKSSERSTVVLAGSSMTSKNSTKKNASDLLPILSGHGTDIVACDLNTMNIAIRLRSDPESRWSDLIPINYKSDEDGMTKLALKENNGNDENSVNLRDGVLLKNRTVNVQSFSRFGTPTTMGVKITPRLKVLRQNVNFVKYVIGFDIIIHSELWIKNLTNLPILFGARANQLYSASLRSGSLNSIHESSRKKAAEAALMELSSILEFGEKGHGIGGNSCDNEILPLSQQECPSVTEEVFEYTEMSKGSAVRQWWAGEHHESIRPDLSACESLQGTEWAWKDDSWYLDTSGECKPSQGGWESSNSLSNFSRLRTYKSLHRFRRRRWYRQKTKVIASGYNGSFSDGSISSFYQPLLKCTDKAAKKSASMDTRKKGDGSLLDLASDDDNKENLSLFFKVGDGAWSAPAKIPLSGAAHGILRIPASRWLSLAKHSKEDQRDEAVFTGNSLSVGLKGSSNVKFSKGSLSPRCYDVSYRVNTMEGHWGEHSRIIVLYPRFFIRNDSEKWYLDVKQAGAPDKTAMRLKPGSSGAFFWADSALSEIINVRPVPTMHLKNEDCIHSWSGGFDISALGMIPLRIRPNADSKLANRKASSSSVKVIRSLVELRSGTGGTGILVSLKEELDNGEDSLYRIENQCPFPLWISQDGSDDKPNTNGDIVLPDEKIPYGLDEPYRETKRAGRRAVSLERLLRARIGLAPLLSIDGVESTKVISLSRVGANLRLKPSKLRTFFDEDTIVDLMSVNIQCVVSSDGPTRVLSISIMERDLTARTVIKNSVRMHTSGAPNNILHDEELVWMMRSAANTTISLLRSKALPKYSSKVNYSNKISAERRQKELSTTCDDCQYSFRASISGFIISLIDKVPSEVALVTVRKINAMAEWNAHRSTEATGALSVGWMQVDNHCPNAPFPVALSPSQVKQDENTGCDKEEADDPFLSVGIVLAPSHKSMITCLEGVTISFSDISLGTDLALVMRIQHHLLGILNHLDRCKDQREITDAQNVIHTKEIWQFPNLKQILSLQSVSKKTGSKMMYFEAITILPFTLKLSVAPSVALTSAQAALEGPVAGAIHAAVRKGDLLIGEKADGVVGVKIGSKNRTAMAVIRGIFKSILVDSLLRCDDVSLNFSGLAVRNHFSTIPQLKTFIGHHYLSLLKSNVPALLGSLAAFGNPVGLIRGFGDGVTDFVSEPVKGFKRSVEELDPSYVMDGVARGTGSLARHTVGGIVDSVSLLTETFSKNMAVLTLDRKYAQRRDRFKTVPGANITFVDGVESGAGKLIRGVAEGVIGVVRAPMRGAEKRGVEGFAKGVGKGLLGLIVKPVIGISDAATDLMVGVKGSLRNKTKSDSIQSQIRPRRAFYGRDRRLRLYIFVDAISAAIMMRTKLGGENYLSHVDMGGRVVILSVRRILLLGDDGDTQLLVKLKNIKRIDLRQVPTSTNNGLEWGLLIFLKTARSNGNEVEVITCGERDLLQDLCVKIQQGVALLE